MFWVWVFITVVQILKEKYVK